jgi:ankyrin repeat protein
LDITATDNQGRNALNHLILNHQTPDHTVVQLLDHNTSKLLNNQKDSEGFTPMYYALQGLRPQVCGKLADMGCDLLGADPHGKTALHHIARHFNEQVCRTPCIRSDEEYHADCCRLWQRILDLGGDLDGQDDHGWPPLFHFFDSGEPMICGDFLTHADGFPCLFDSADVDLHVQNDAGETVLHILAKWKATHPMFPSGDLTSFQLMLHKGVDPLAGDLQGRSSLDVAAACGSEDILWLFAIDVRGAVDD